MAKKNDLIYGINGPIIKVKNTDSFFMYEMVHVGDGLVGEVIKINKEFTTIQIYEDATGLTTRDKVVGMKKPMGVLLGPGLIGNIFDGIERSLGAIKDIHGDFIPGGCRIDISNNENLWNVKILVKVGDEVSYGMIFATCAETSVVEHRFLIPLGVEGKVISIAERKEFKLTDTVIEVKNKDKVVGLNLLQFWPIRQSRPVKKRHSPNKPLITGQRVIDTLFPMAKGGCAMLPGGFGAGKTVTQHQLAKWCNVDVVIYVGCGERGNEMTQILEEFGELIDPKTGKSMLERTIFIANTSNMPVSAREASIYTGVTLAEYYRDMGYDVVMLADSTSRWAEALREISGRLEEIPAEEGYPAYLSSRLAEFYERAGNFTSFSDRESSITLIGAVSPQGSDFSEPVTQNSKRFTRCFWALDKSLAYIRHYPTINWRLSYSEYVKELEPWFELNIGEEFVENRKKIVYILEEEAKLLEITKLVGQDIMADDQKLVLETAKLIRIGFLQQNIFNDFDKFVSLEKQRLMMSVILYLYKKSKELITNLVPMSKIIQLDIFQEISKMKYNMPADCLEKFKSYIELIDQKLDSIV
ncbi:MAG: V-type ATP synthase subunit A [Candidatus Improbicoccus pseudotrichonymphae]|uniref:V-type ATP synthase alpha chain n=1 Tax=Candidatus Improbicoccus pseudotrichonymphae TaxID=3033792 RepID=A0AA48HUW6_9FIRM|nr:MAG: V-type ATP synthase subunit A [Candidatus Improbicoccus pseudotrichonymphae]